MCFIFLAFEFVTAIITGKLIDSMTWIAFAILYLADCLWTKNTIQRTQNDILRFIACKMDRDGDK